jgi:serine/threonine protein kinase
MNVRSALSVHELTSSGGNAAVYKVGFPREHAVVLKTAKESQKDNLSFEHQVGLWVNTLNDDLFCRTVGFYKARPGKVNLNFVRALHPILKIPLECETNENKFLALEYFDGESALEIMQSGQRTTEFIHHLPLALYRIYNTLSSIDAKFTHYDLHLGNVLFDKAYNPKIIDFGRCHFPGVAKLEKQVCAVCHKCGIPHGYWFQANGKSLSTALDHFINPAAPNRSHDLLYLFKLKLHFGDAIYRHSPALYTLLNNVVYATQWGTPERIKKNTKFFYETPRGTQKRIKNNGFICTVQDAKRELKLLLQRRSTRNAPKRSRPQVVRTTRSWP